MMQATKLVSLVALAATIVPSVLYYGGWTNHATVTRLALIATIAWFVATPVWMGREAAK